MKWLIPLILILALLAGCGSSECDTDSDCTAGKCFTAKCEDGECKKDPVRNCCGNGMQEEGENACNCPQDATEKCEGKVTVKTIGSRDIESEYLEYMCKDDKCVVGIDESEQREIPLTFDKQFARFKIGFNVNFNEPFNIDKDKINIEGKLRSTSDSLKPPLKINQIKIIGGETLYGSKNLDVSLKKGDTFTTEIPIDYVPEDLETEERLKMKVFYEETYFLDRETNKTRTPSEQEYIKIFDQELYLVNPGEEK